MVNHQRCTRARILWIVCLVASAHLVLQGKLRADGKVDKPVATPKLPTRKQVINFRTTWTDPKTAKQIRFVTKHQILKGGSGPDRVKWPGLHKRWIRSQKEGHQWIRLLAHLEVVPETPVKSSTGKTIKLRDGAPIHYHVLNPDGKLIHSVSLRKTDACYH